MFQFGRGVCYSGYRQNHSPVTRVYPTDQEVLEDLQLLSKNFDYIRMYDTSWHAYSVLRVLHQYQIKLKVMLGTEGGGEISNPNCPWGGLHSDEEIAYNKLHNFAKLDELCRLANSFPNEVLAVSVGNENTADWHSNKISPSRIAEYVRYVKTKVSCPVTFCEGANYYRDHNHEIAEAVDVISIHCYPVWTKTPISEAVQSTIDDYLATKLKYPNKPIIFTEFGWPTSSNQSMNPSETNVANQEYYLDAMTKWSLDNQVTMFIFEAFDEPWKGGNDPIEPEKHWGIYDVHRQPKNWIKKRN